MNCTNQDGQNQNTDALKKEPVDLFKKKLPEKKKNKKLSLSDRMSALDQLNLKAKNWTKFEVHNAVIMNIENSRLNGNKSNIDDDELKIKVIQNGNDNTVIMHFEKIVPNSNWHIELNFESPLKVGKYPLSSRSHFGYFESLSIDDYYATTEQKSTLIGNIEIIKSDDKQIIGTAKFTIPKLEEFSMTTQTKNKDFKDVKVDLAFYTTAN